MVLAHLPPCSVAELSKSCVLRVNVLLFIMLHFPPRYTKVRCGADSPLTIPALR